MMHFKYDSHVDIPNGMHAAVKGKLLQATFQPVWVDGLEKGAYSVSDSFAREKPVKRPRTDAGPGDGNTSERNDRYSSYVIHKKSSSAAHWPDNEDSPSTHKEGGPSFHGNGRSGGTSDSGRRIWHGSSKPVDNVSA